MNLLKTYGRKKHFRHISSQPHRRQSNHDWNDLLEYIKNNREKSLDNVPNHDKENHHENIDVFEFVVNDSNAIAKKKEKSLKKSILSVTPIQHKHNIDVLDDPNDIVDAFVELSISRPEHISDHLDLHDLASIITQVEDCIASPIEDVLKVCEQELPIPFDQIIKEMSSIYSIQKIGESTFSEVFQASLSEFNTSLDSIILKKIFGDSLPSKVVLKILPIELYSQSNENPNDQSIPFQSKSLDVAHEILVSRQLSSSKWNGFIRMYGSVVTKGVYDINLVNSWKAYHQDPLLGPCENVSPEVFTSDQHYAIIFLSFGGTDLEHIILRDAKDALIIIGQVVFAILWAQRRFHFEHRDLHMGNVLIEQFEEPIELEMNLLDNDLIIVSHDLRCSIIDYSLSRMEPDSSTNTIVYADLDDSLFNGDASIDQQYEVYRQMKNICHSRSNNCASIWQQYIPDTNRLWILYLLDKLISLPEFKKKRSKTHLERMSVLKKIKDSLLNDYTSLEEWFIKWYKDIFCLSK